MLILILDLVLMVTSFCVLRNTGGIFSSKFRKNTSFFFGELCRNVKQKKRKTRCETFKGHLFVCLAAFVRAERRVIPFTFRGYRFSRDAGFTCLLCVALVHVATVWVAFAGTQSTEVTNAVCRHHGGLVLPFVLCRCAHFDVEGKVWSFFFVFLRATHFFFFCNSCYDMEVLKFCLPAFLERTIFFVCDGVSCVHITATRRTYRLATLQQRRFATLDRSRRNRHGTRESTRLP